MFFGRTNSITLIRLRKPFAIGGCTMMLFLVCSLLHFPEHIAAAANTQTSGQVQGRVEIKSVLTTVSRQWGTRYRTRGQTAEHHQVKKPQRPEVTNVVVYLEELGTKRKYAPPPQSAKLVQSAIEFVPHILPVLKGSKVDIVNHDDFYHNVFSNSSVKKFNIGKQLTNAVVSEVFNEVGFIPVFCDIHLEMSAYIVVLENPYFTTPDETGSFTIDNVPAGTYRVVAWHERLVTQSEEITVSDGEAVTVQFTM